MFIFSTVIAYGVKITTKVPDHCCDLGVKGHVLEPEPLFHFLTEGVHILHNDCLWGVYNTCFEIWIWPWNQDQIHLNLSAPCNVNL